MGCFCFSSYKTNQKTTSLQIKAKKNKNQEDIQRLLAINRRKIPILDKVDFAKFTNRRKSLGFINKSDNKNAKNPRKLNKQQTI